MDAKEIIKLRSIVKNLEKNRLVCLSTDQLCKYLKELLILEGGYLEPFETELMSYLKYRDVIFDTVSESPTHIDYYFSYCYDENDKYMEKRIRKGIIRIAKKFNINIKDIKFQDNFHGFVRTLLVVI